MDVKPSTAVNYQGEHPTFMYVSTGQSFETVWTEKDAHRVFLCVPVVPTLDPIGQPKTLLEHICFMHQCDSRKPHNQPYQGGVRHSS